MSNEEIVEEIKKGHKVNENMQKLYDNNLYLIKKIALPYCGCDDIEDLMQEAYFGLWEAVQHYETSENVKFMTYAKYWILSSISRYIDKYSSIYRIPYNMFEKIKKYKRVMEKIKLEKGINPTDEEIAKEMNICILDLYDIKKYAQGVTSLDILIGEDCSLYDVIKSDLNVEESVLDKIYAEYSKNELWGIVERHTSNLESTVLNTRFLDNKTYSEISKINDLSLERVRQIEKEAIRKLRRGSALKELKEKFDVVNNRAYRDGLKKYKEHNFTSMVENIAISNLEIKNEYISHA